MSLAAEMGDDFGSSRSGPASTTPSLTSPVGRPSQRLDLGRRRHSLKNALFAEQVEQVVHGGDDQLPGQHR
jgi:hypothetical protein